MDKVIFAIFGLTVVTALLLSGLNPLAREAEIETSGDSKCLDFNPPNSSKQVTFKGAKYSLIKINARVSGPNPKNGEEDKYGLAMERIGELDDGTPVRNLNKPNIFGQSLDNFKDIIYVQKEQKDGATFFDIYIKEGAEIPDIAKNCKTMGGNIAVNLGFGAAGSFPPAVFNRDEIQNLNPNFTVSSLAPAYVLAPPPNSKVPKSQIEAQTAGDDKTFGKLKAGSSTYDLYHHLGLLYLIDGSDAYVYMNSPIAVDNTPRQANKSLQLDKVQIISSPLYTWHTPECKPAIYLYPKEKTDVRVKVRPAGYFTYTDPPYPDGGWSVIAHPDGKIETGGEIYPYLYYESSIANSSFEPPTEGFTVKYEGLPAFFDGLLPSLGLSVKEAADFKDYWLKTLPFANYYFVGILDQGTIDTIEHMTIDPKPDTMIRVRLYFEALDIARASIRPVIETPERNGYLAVEWGGMVKSNQHSKFTCSQ